MGEVARLSSNLPFGAASRVFVERPVRPSAAQSGRVIEAIPPLLSMTIPRHDFIPACLAQRTISEARPASGTTIAPTP